MSEQIRYSDKEDGIIIKNRSKGISDEQTAAQLGRTKHAIQDRITKLRSRGLEIASIRYVYMPGVPIVPCAVCGSEIDRRGSGRGHTKYCSKDCSRISSVELSRIRRGYKPRNTSGICPRCNVNEKGKRPDGKYRSWCRSCESKQKGVYQASPVGKAVIKKYQQSEKGKLNRKLWMSSRGEISHDF